MLGQQKTTELNKLPEDMESSQSVVLDNNNNTRPISYTETKAILQGLCSCLKTLLKGYGNIDEVIEGIGIGVEEVAESADKLIDSFIKYGVPITFTMIRTTDERWAWGIYPKSDCTSYAPDTIKEKIKNSLKKFYKESEIYYQEDRLLFQPLAKIVNQLHLGFYLTPKKKRTNFKHEDKRIIYIMVKDLSDVKINKKKESLSHLSRELKKRTELEDEEYLLSESSEDYESEMSEGESESSFFSSSSSSSSSESSSSESSSESSSSENNRSGSVKSPKKPESVKESKPDQAHEHEKSTGKNTHANKKRKIREDEEKIGDKIEDKIEKKSPKKPIGTI